MISIIIPTLNEEKILESILSGLKKNLTLPHEIIISDGKSKDMTAEIARQYADTVLIYEGTIRQNISMGRNDGAKAARGEYLLFLDADCTIPNPDAFFTRALSHFEADKDLVALAVSLKVLPEHETVADRMIFGLVNTIFRFYNNVLHIGNMSGEFQMMRKDAYLKVKGFREDLVAGEDRDMFYRLSRVGKTLFDPKLTVFHTGRRAHKIGWPKLLSIWILNIISVSLFKKSASKEWTPIR